MTITCLAVNDFITLTLLAGSSVILVCWVEIRTRKNSNGMLIMRIACTRFMIGTKN